MNNNFDVKRVNTRIKAIHKYNKFTGFYSFLGASLKKATLPIIGFIVVLFLFDLYVLDLGDVFVRMTETFPTVGVLTIFFASESFLGLIPPEIFIAWSEKADAPLLMLSALAGLSYLGGIISYLLGKGIANTKSLQQVIESKMNNHITNTRKWGGLLIIAGALLPIPFSMVSIAAGIINYKLRNYLLFGLLRFVRFYLYAIAIFSLL